MNADGKVNILLVDDQPAKLLSYEVILADLHENLIKAGSAQEALACLLRTDVAVVLVDACMPDMDGFELASMIRKHPRCDRTSIILVSAVYLSDFDRLRGYGCGAVDYVPVPVVPDLLRAKVGVFADLYRKTEQLTRLNAELERRVAERTAELEASTAHLGESEERFRTLADHAPVGIFLTDVTGNCLFVNQKWSEMTGLAPEQARGKGWLAAIHPDDRTAIAAEWADAVREKTAFAAENRFLHPDGRIAWLQGRAVQITNSHGAVVGHIGTLVDTTQRRADDEERTRLLDSERRARSLAEQANRQKDEFLAMLSHELRTPINAVLAWVQLMGRGSLDAETTAEGLRVIERGVRTQVRLIDELLDVNRISSGIFRISQEPVDLAAAFNAALETVEPDAGEKRLRIVHRGDANGIRLRGDATKLQQVFWNLLVNAAKFTPAGGRIETDIQRAGDQVRITVADTGQGIKPEFLPHIFERFRQGDSSTTRKHGGLGLGLAIARYIVEMHGGTIAAHSEGEGRGSRFTVTLPVESLAPAVAAAPPTGAEPLDLDLSRVRVLIVDDDRATRDVVSRSLAEYGAQTATADSADDALRAFAADCPDVLICDIGMPLKDGYALIREIRELPRGADLPAVALTAYTGLEDRERALAAGFHAHVPKPVSPYQLVLAVASVLTDRNGRADRTDHSSPAAPRPSAASTNAITLSRSSARMR